MVATRNGTVLQRLTFRKSQTTQMAGAVSVGDEGAVSMTACRSATALAARVLKVAFEIVCTSCAQGELYILDQVLLPPSPTGTEQALEHEGCSSRLGLHLDRPVDLGNAAARKLRNAPQAVGRYATVDEALEALELNTSKALLGFTGGLPVLLNTSFQVRAYQAEPHPAHLCTDADIVEPSGNEARTHRHSFHSLLRCAERRFC